jgi:hypothetical protein
MGGRDKPGHDELVEMTVCTINPIPPASRRINLHHAAFIILPARRVEN